MPAERVEMRRVREILRYRFEQGLGHKSIAVLLGMRISVDLLIGLGAGTILLLVSAMAATICFGLLAAKLLGRGWRMALITSGSVAICGASAAMAIAAVLPKNEFS